uniref:Uncharacterized protein n=1 Tax=Chryseobacterium endophyticum TaxID=1854762 RepID=A0AAU6WLD8_9FLAO
MQILSLKTATSAAAICFSTVVFAQQNYSVSGTLKDKKNGELLIGVTVKVAEDLIFPLYQTIMVFIPYHYRKEHTILLFPIRALKIFSK